jgi:hypothetical protein
MLIVFCIPPPESKRLFSTTSDLQRTPVDILRLSNELQPNFALHERVTAENGLDPERRGRDEKKLMIVSCSFL